MKRQVSLEEISDGRLYGPNDLVKADCGDCRGCSDCCHGMGSSVILDPMDVYRLTGELGKPFAQLLEQCLELNVVDGMILPNLRMAGRDEACIFLNEQGRCSIHPFRPGVCRLFPLGRYYEEGGFRYFLQIHECRKDNRTKIRVRKWIDTPDPCRYDRFVTDWHYFLEALEKLVQGSERIKEINLYVLQQFFVKPYVYGEAFYPQFYARLEEAGQVLELT